MKSRILTPTPSVPKEVRIRQYQFDLGRFCEMFITGTTLEAKVRQGWPEDAIIVGLHSDEKTYSFTVLVQSKEFDVVKENEQIPYGEIWLDNLKEKHNG